jgi:thioredoxin 1
MEKDQFFEKLRKNPLPVVVDIWAPWCMPCRAIAPQLEKLGQEYAGQVDVWKVNADENASLVQSLGVRSIPTLIVYRGDSELARRTGVQPQAALRELFQSALDGVAPATRGLAASDRLLRLFAGTVVLLLGLYTGPSWLLLGVAGVVLFSAVYDRCPIWQAISPRLARYLDRLLHPAGSSSEQV